MPDLCLSVGIETEKNAPVDQGILLLSPGTLLYFSTGGTNNGLDFVAVDETGNIRVRNLGGRETKKMKISFKRLEGKE